MLGLSLSLSGAERIAFVASVEKTWQLFTVEPDGGGLRQLTRGKADSRLPDWFPDRKRLVFTTSDGAAYVIEEADGRISDTIAAAEARLWQAAVEPDGKSLLIIAGNPKEIDKTFLLRFDMETRKMSRVLQLDTPLYGIDVSPRGDLLLANNQCGSACGHMIQEIWLRDADGLATRQLTLSDAHCGYPAWHPSRGRFLFDCTRDGRSAIWIQDMRPDSRAEPWSEIGDGEAGQPALSPDGSRVAFIRNGALHVAPLDAPAKAAHLQLFPQNLGARIKDPRW